MSRVLDALERIGRESSAPMGFRNTTRETKRRSMVIVGAFNHQGNLTRGRHSYLQDLKFDGALLQGNCVNVPEEVIPHLKNVPWGVKLPELKTKKMYGQWCKAGADFFVCDAENVNVKAIESEGTGFFLSIKPSLEDRYLRTIESLPVDGVIVDCFSAGYGVKTPITLQGLMELSGLRTMVDKYFLLEIPSSPLSKSEMESLLHIGVDGLVVSTDYSIYRSVQKVIRYSDEISSLSVGKSGRSTALLPHGPFASESSSSQEEEGEEF